MLTINTLTLNDNLTDVLQLIRDTDEFIYSALMPDMAKAKGLLIEDAIYNANNILLAKVDNEVAGILIAVTNKANIPTTDNELLRSYYAQLIGGIGDNALYISNISVSANFRGRGVATALISHCLNNCSKSTVELDCLENNTNALRLYRSLGFVDVKRNRAFVGTSNIELYDIRMAISVTHKHN